MKSSFYYAGALIAVIVIISTAFILSSSNKPASSPTPIQSGHKGSQLIAANNQNARPQFTLTSLKTGKIIDVNHFNGKPTLLKLGTTYCEVCQREIPEMKQAYREFGDSANIAFVLIGSSKQQAQAYADRYDLPYPVYTDQGSASRTFNVLGTPTHAILTADGTLANRQVGFMSARQITSALNQLL